MTSIVMFPSMYLQRITYNAVLDSFGKVGDPVSDLRLNFLVLI